MADDPKHEKRGASQRLPGDGGEAPIQKLVQGIHAFQSQIFSSQKELFEHLAQGQDPDTLLITCSDSRINPNLITQTDPGELFILRNAGNIVPPFGAANGGEGATIEYAVSVLGVEHIIVVGHTQCGAVGAMLEPDKVKHLPAVEQWLRHAESTRRIVGEVYPGLDTARRQVVATEENVLCQLENLRTHPAVAVAIAKGKLHLHAWVYAIATGEVFAYDPEQGQFAPVSEIARSVQRTPRQKRSTRFI
jgi:carbonic anhydrase